MDNQFYIKVGSLFWIIQAIPESAIGDTVSVAIKRLSDGYTWNFTTTAFTAAATSGTMTFISDILWKQSFTPPTEDTYIVTINDETLDVKYVQVLKALGAVAQAGVTGTELTTLAHVRELLRTDTNFTTDDTFIENLITRISDDIEKQCNRSFHAADYTEYHNGDGTSKLLLKQYPVNSITSIYDDLDREYNADDLIDSDDYAISDSDAGIVELDGLTFAKGINNIKVTYNAGYSTIPTDLEQTCIRLVAREYQITKPDLSSSKDNLAKLDKWKEDAEKVIASYVKIR